MHLIVFKPQKRQKSQIQARFLVGNFKDNYWEKINQFDARNGALIPPTCTPRKKTVPSTVLNLFESKDVLECKIQPDDFIETQFLFKNF